MNRLLNKVNIVLYYVSLRLSFSQNLLAIANILDYEQRPDKHARVTMLIHKLLPKVYLSLQVVKKSFQFEQS